MSVYRLIPFLLFFVQISFSQNIHFGEVGNPIDGKIKVATIDGCSSRSSLSSFNQCSGNPIQLKFSRPIGTGTNQFYITTSIGFKKFMFKFSNVSNVIELNVGMTDFPPPSPGGMNFKHSFYRVPEFDYCKLIKLFKNAQSVYIRGVMYDDNIVDYEINLSGSKKALDYVLLEDIIPGYCRHYCDSFDSDGNWNNLDGRVNCNDYN